MLSDTDLQRIEARHKSDMSCQDARTLLVEVKRLRSPLTGEDARLVESVRERLAKATPGPWEDDDGAILEPGGYGVAHIQDHGNANTIARTGETYSRADAALIANAPTDLQALLDLLSRYEHATYDRELDAGAFVAMERARIVAWLRGQAKEWRYWVGDTGQQISTGTSNQEHGRTGAIALDSAAGVLEALGVADPAPPAVVRAELARVRAKVREVMAQNIPTNIAAMLREALEGEKTP